MTSLMQGFLKLRIFHPPSLMRAIPAPRGIDQLRFASENIAIQLRAPAFRLLDFFHEFWGFSRTTWILGFFGRKLRFFLTQLGFFLKKDEIWGFFDKKDPPGREFRAEGKQGTFGA